MFARSILIAVAVAMGVGSAVAAEPAKAPPAQSAEQHATATPVLMASANIDQAGAAVVSAAATESTDATAAPAKRPRRGRVTTCRCADTPNQ